MTTAWDQIRGDASPDVLVIVDDWKGTRSTDYDSPVCLVGRTYRRNDAFERLVSLLDAANAQNWHVGKSRRRSLFKARGFDEIIGTIEAGSTLLTQLWIYDQYRRNEVADFLQTLPVEVRDAWDVKHPHAIALLEYAMRVRWYIGNVVRRNAEQVSVLIVADSQDWLPSMQDALHPLGPLPPSCIKEISRVSVEVVVAGNKRKCGAAILQLLGLADSEAWAHGRFASSPLSDGSTVHERMVEWQQSGAAHNLGVHDVQAMLSSGFGNFRKYLESSLDWPLMGLATSLTTAHDPDALVKSLANAMVRLAVQNGDIAEQAAAKSYERLLMNLREKFPRPSMRGSWTD